MRMLALVVLAACTGSGQGAGHANVEVTVYALSPPGARAVDVPVAFVNPNGVGYIVRTDADGKAHGVMVEGGSVTALVRDADNPPALSSIMGVRDGDQLMLGFKGTPDPAPPPSGTPACTQVDLTGTFTNVTTHAISSLVLARFVRGSEGAWSAEETIAPTVQRTLTGIGATSVDLNVMLNGPDNANQWIADAIDGCQTEYDLDMSQLLPWIGPMTTQGGRIEIPQSRGTLAGDVLSVMVSYSTPAEEFASWSILSPPTEQLDLPRLPDELASMTPTEISDVAVQLDEYASLDYDAVRAMFGPTTGIGASAGAEYGRSFRSYRIQ